MNKLIFASLNILLFGGLVGLTTPSESLAQNSGQTSTARHPVKNKKTINQMLQEMGDGGRKNGANVNIKKQAVALPQAQAPEAPHTAVPLYQVKPPRSNDLFREGGTDEEKLESVTEEGIQELYRLTQQYSKSPNRGELWLRLAELYVEKAKFIEYRIQKDYDDKSALYFAKKGRKPVLNLGQSKEYNSKAIKLYEFYLRDFPKSPKVDQALFFLGYNYVELDQVKKGIAYYQRLTTEFPNSLYVGEAHFALGEYFFDNDKWADALKAYSNVLKNRRARLYTFALYKIAWCQYRMGRVGQGLKTLESVVQLSRRPEASDNSSTTVHKAVSKIRLGSEALKDIVLFYADAGNYKGASDYFLQIGGEKAQYIMLEKLAYLYADSGRRDEAYYIFKQLLDSNPTGPKAFDYQYQIVSIFSTAKEQSTYRTELFSWIDNYSLDSAWAKANANNKKLLDDSYTLRESALRNYVILLHKNAQNSQKKGELVVTKQAYELYLARFGDSPRATEMHFFYGELLYAMGEYPAAAKEYLYVADKDPKGKYYEQAVLNDLLSLEKGLKTDEQIHELVGDSIEPVPFTEVEAAFIAAGQRYVKTFPHGDRSVDVKFKMGRLHYSYNQFDDALVTFKQIVKESPRTQYAVYSANLILDIYNLRKDYTSLAREGKAFMKNKPLIEAGFQTDVSDLVERASFKKAQDLEVQKDYGGSGKAFAEFVQQYPKSPLASSAAFNAGINYERAHNIPQAIVFYNKTANNATKGNENSRNKSILLLARLYEQTAQYDKAALEFEKYARANPKDKLTADLFYNSAIIWEGEKEFYKAIADYQKYFDISRKRSRVEALYKIAKIQEKLGHLKTAQEEYDKYLNTQPTDPEKIVESTFRVADINERRNKHEDAEKGYRRTVNVQKHFAEQGKNVGQVYAAEAKFRLVDKVYADFVSVRIPANPNKQAAAIKEKLGLLTRLNNNLAEVIKYDEGNMVIASLTKLGQAYEHMSKTIWHAPLPKDLNAQELAAYKKGVDGVARPLENQAIQNYSAAITKSYELNFYNKYTKTALDAMARFQPEKYGEPKETVIATTHSDEMGL